MNNLFIGLVLLLFGIIIFFYLKLREVSLSESKILLYSLFSELELDKTEVNGIEETILSPIVYQISIKNGRKIYFIVNEKTLVKESSKLGSGLLLKKLNEELMK